MKTLIPKLTLSLLVTGFVTVQAMAQVGVTIPKDTQGRRIIARTDVSVLEGSPFLYDTWETGTVKFKDGTIYEGVNLKYDQLDEQLMFSIEGGEPQAFVHPVYEFIIEGPNKRKHIFRTGFSPIDGNSVTTFYEVLVEGDVQLLKRNSKNIVEESPYGSSTKIKHIKDNTSYYVVTDGKLAKIKNAKRSVLAALDDKSAEITKYVKDHKVNFKDDKDLVEVVAYYNKLQD